MGFNNTYRAIVRCSNCGEINHLAIKRGTYIDEKACLFCGCYTLKRKENKDEKREH